MSAFSPEILERVFAFIKDDRSLSALIRVSRDVRSLAKRELIRNKHWEGKESHGLIERWRTDERRRGVQEITIHWARSLEAVAGLRIFLNLTSLTLLEGWVSNEMFSAVLEIPRLG